MTQSDWHRAVTDALADAYLAENDPRWRSGFDGDAELWREARAFVLDAVPQSGSFLDVGAANGHLIECLALKHRASMGVRLRRRICLISLQLTFIR